MTVLAWDGRTFAADKLACYGATRNTVTKIFRRDGALIGICGTLSVGMEMVEWYDAGCVPKDFPSSNRGDTGSSLVVVKANGEVWKYESGPYPHKIEGPFCAFGSGDEPALAAMECGADARRAVEVASKFNTGCGNGVDTLSFE